MQQTDTLQRFSFGEINDTVYEYLSTKTQLVLPYNPFSFDLSLKIISTVLKVQQGLCMDIVSGKKIIIGRKKKQYTYLINNNSTYLLLNAPTVSEQHCLIDEKYCIYDLNSKKGSYLWVHRKKSHQLAKDDQFIVCSQIIKIIHVDKNELIFNLQKKIIKIERSDKLYLIGSHNKCHLKIKNAKQFQIAIDLNRMLMFNLIQDEDYSLQYGVWRKITTSPQKAQKIIEGNLIMIYPYIFSVQTA